MLLYERSELSNADASPLVLSFGGPQQAGGPDPECTDNLLLDDKIFKLSRTEILQGCLLRVFGRAIPQSLKNYGPKERI